MLRETVIEWTSSGRPKGWQKGWSGGVGMRPKLLIQLLEQKFGRLPHEERAKIESAAADRLLEWARRLLTARSLGEVLAS